MPTKARIPLPSVLDPLTTKCVQFNIPDDPEWQGMFWGALNQLSVWTAFERSNDTSAADVASVWRQVIADARVSECGGPVPCPNWYLDNVLDICSVQSANAQIFNVPDCDCSTYPHIYIGRATLKVSGQEIYSIEARGFDTVSSDPVGGHFCTVQAVQTDQTIGNVFTWFTEDCIGGSDSGTAGGQIFTKTDFVAKGICIQALAPFVVTYVIDGDWICGVA